MDLYDYGTPVNISAPQVRGVLRVKAAERRGGGRGCRGGLRPDDDVADRAAAGTDGEALGPRRPARSRKRAMPSPGEAARGRARGVRWRRPTPTRRAGDLRGRQPDVTAVQRDRAARGDVLGGRRQRAPVGHAAAGQPEGLPSARRPASRRARAAGGSMQGETGPGAGAAGGPGARGGDAATPARSKRCSVAAACISSSTCASSRAPRVGAAERRQRGVDPAPVEVGVEITEARLEAAPHRPECRRMWPQLHAPAAVAQAE